MREIDFWLRNVGYWSLRINQEHRLVYAFDNAHVTIIQYRFHYKA